MQIHPFLSDRQYPYATLPSQNIPLKKKNKKWREANMDALDIIAQTQFWQKQPLLKNYQMVNGELVNEDYLPDGAESEILDLFAEKRVETGRYEKHYDIISQPLSALEGQLDSFPDVFHVVGKGDMIESERSKVKTQMLREWFQYQMQQNINAALPTQDDPDKDLYAEEIPEEEEAPLPPKEIERYLSSDYRHILEIWAQYELEDQFERFKLKALRREEFHHLLVSAERYRHIYKDADGLKVRSENPLFVATHKSPSLKFTQDGDYTSVVRILSVAAIIDEFGHLMTDKQLDSLQTPYEDHTNKDKRLGTDINGKPIKYTSPQGIPYQTRVQTLDPIINNFYPKVKDFTNGGGVYYTNTEMSKVNGWGGDFQAIGGMLVVLKGYWKSQLRVGKLTWNNPETGEYEVIEIDDNFVVPAYIKEIKDEKYNYIGALNTIVWTRVTQVWEGIKISNYGNDGYLSEPIYLDIKPADIQIGKLPIFGQFLNNINTKPTSFVDKIKNWQFFYNVLMNEAFHFLTTEWLPYITYDIRDVPKDKDWTTEKWIEMAQNGDPVPIDSSPENRGGSSNTGGQYPKMVDLDRSTRIITRLNTAAAIRQLALEQVGITPQAMGQIKSTETATGIQQATTGSSNQTSSYFASFFEGEREMLQGQIDAAKYLQAQDGEFSTQVVKSDLSLQALKFSLEDGDLYDLHLYVTDSQEELRKLQMAQRLGLENNTSDLQMSDRLGMSVNSSFRDIQTKLIQSEQSAIARQQQEIQLQQQQLQQQGMNAEQALAQAERHFMIEQQVKLQVATLNALGRQQNSDVDTNGISDVLDYNKTLAILQGVENQNIFNQGKLALDQEKLSMSKSLEEKKLRDMNTQRKHEKQMKQLDLKRDTIRGDKSK